MEKRCLIYSGGEYCRTEGIVSPEFVIACDRGLAYAEKDHIQPDLILGDFDSYEGAMTPEALGAVRYPAEKDDTDTMLAVKYALGLGYTDITIACALGARLDHTVANIQTGAYIAEHGGRAVLLGRDDIVHVFAGGSILLPRREGWSLSVFSLSDRAGGVRLRGTKYPAENAELTSGFPLGVSNEWSADTAEVSAENGVIMVIESRVR